MKRRDETTATVISVMAPSPRAALRTRAVAMALSRIPEDVASSRLNSNSIRVAAPMRRTRKRRNRLTLLSRNTEMSLVLPS